MNPGEFRNLIDGRYKTTGKFPVMFIGHGNPMNAIEENEFSEGWKTAGTVLPRPNAILCISAHWLTRGTFINFSPNPVTIHDFYGFPPELFAVQYPAPGDPETAQKIVDHVKKTSVAKDLDWGLDHGCWSVLNKMYPEADIPVFQMSIDYTRPEAYHLELGAELDFLRQRGVLIFASGNIVHNLRTMVWKDVAYDWALEFDETAKSRILQRDFNSLVRYPELGTAALNSIPTNDHYLPMFYALSQIRGSDEVEFFNEKVTAGSVSMRSFIIY